VEWRSDRNSPGHRVNARCRQLTSFFAEQWHLFNIGQGGGIPGVDANVLGAWDVTLGNGINIAVVDDGLQTNHPDLRENCPEIASNLHHDFIDVDNDPRPTEFDNHGTSVAGVAAARQNNGTINPANGSLLGVSGSAPEAKLVGLRLIAGPFTDLDSATALYWKPSNFVIGVSNNSWGPFDGSGLHGPDVLTKAALEKATAEGRGGNGQITVFASGNSTPSWRVRRSSKDRKPRYRRPGSRRTIFLCNGLP
jgi:furin